MTTASEAATELADEFDEHLDVDDRDIEGQVAELADEYSIPISEAKRSVRNQLLDEAGIEDTNADTSSTDAVDNAFQPTDIEQINRESEWYDIRAEVIELWDPNADNMAQVGLLGDDTDVIKFVVWEDTPVPTLEEGATYELQNVVSEEYQGRYSVKLTKTTAVTEVEGTDGRTIEGVLVDIKNGSGLIKRCPDDDCTRVLQNGRCSVHGKVDGEFDLRIKGVIDDGQTAHSVVFGEERTSELSGLGLEEATEMAMDALDTGVVADELRDSLIGQYYRVEGPQFGDNLVADDVAVLNDVPASQVEDLAARVREDDADVAADVEAGSESADAAA